jgi:zinc transporter 9
MIAASLIMGFSFMLLVEHLTGSDHSHVHPGHGDLFDLEVINENGVATDRIEVMEREPTTYTGNRSKKAIKLTLGLVVHSLADGFALGASAVSARATDMAGPDSSHSELPLVIFFALLIHKGVFYFSNKISPCSCLDNVTIYPLAPAALALSTSLLVTPISRSAIRKHLAVFAASTPVGSILTYLLLSAIGAHSGSAWTGQTLLFSVSLAPSAVCTPERLLMMIA